MCSMRWSNLTLEDDDRSRETLATGAGRFGDASGASVAPIGPRFGQRRLPGYGDGRSCATSTRPRRSTCASTRCVRDRCSIACPAARGCRFAGRSIPIAAAGHACVYCFARPTHTYLGFDAGRDFEREIVVKVNAPEVLRAELGRPRGSDEHVALGTNTDPYQWVEGRYRLMVGIWEAMRDAANPCSVLTKSPLLLRDLPLMLRDRRSARVQREPVDPDARRERVAGNRAAHAATRGHGWRRWPSSTARGSHRRADRAADAGHQRRARTRSSRCWSGREPRARRASAASRCTCAARCRGCSWTGCARQRPDLRRALRGAVRARGVCAARRSGNASRDWCAEGRVGRGASSARGRRRSNAWARPPRRGTHDLSPLSARRGFSKAKRRRRRPGMRCPGRRRSRARQSMTMPAANAPAGSGVGELGSSVRFPPLTANDAITSALLPFTSSVLPSGDRRASTAPAPAEPNGVLPSSTSEPSGLIA